MSTAAVPIQESRPEQNWIVNRWTDILLIIAAPLLAFVWSAVVYVLLGPEMVWSVFMVFNVAHHFPTFIRIYGDKDCMKRFRWALLLGPLFPFAISMMVASFIITDPNGSWENLAFLWIILTIWDPWHFLMQHYGFMRIYDRYNHAPRQLASWMDYLVSATWFIFIMMAAVQWFLGELLYSLFTNHGIPILLWMEPDVYHVFLAVAFFAACGMTIVYLGYLGWCKAKGYFVSYAKLFLLLTTFVVMYITYIPNSLVSSILPEWSFSMGFATLGMVHVTQYLAIVWTYNRSLAQKGVKRSRPGMFTSAFAKGGFAIATVYVAICLFYGATLSDDFAPVFHLARNLNVGGDSLKLVYALMWSIGFTSTFTHYYFDGFIWKVRHKENRENLAMTQNKQAKAAATANAGTTKTTASWWDRGKQNTLGATLFRQFVYFGIPLGLMIVTYLMVATKPENMPITNIQRAYQLQAAGNKVASIDLAERSIEKANEQIQVEKTIAELDDRRRTSHLTYAADLLYWTARAEMEIVVKQRGEPTEADKQAYKDRLQKAVSTMELALAEEGKRVFSHREFSSQRDAVEMRLQSYRDALKDAQAS